MIILGLTGSIAMGKSVASLQFRREGIRVYDADAMVHKMLDYGGCAVSRVARAFPGVEQYGKINRTLLSDKVFADQAALRKLETIIHPLVRKDEQKFLWRASRDRQFFVVLEIPLLFETGREKMCDYVVCVSAPPFLQYLRAMKRPNMTIEKLQFIRARQISNFEKCRRSNFIIHSGLRKSYSLKNVRHIIGYIRLKGSNKNARSGFRYGNDRAESTRWAPCN